MKYVAIGFFCASIVFGIVWLTSRWAGAAWAAPISFLYSLYFLRLHFKDKARARQPRRGTPVHTRE